jgi:hypothetical protein
VGAKRVLAFGKRFTGELAFQGKGTRGVERGGTGMG